MQNEPNILIIKLGALGDFVMQLDCVQAIHRTYPNAHISFMTTKPFVGFVESLGFVENIYIDARPRFNLKQWYKTCKQTLSDNHWDYIFDLQSSSRTLKKYLKIARFLTPYSFKWVSFNKKEGGLNLLDVQKKSRFSWGKASQQKMDLDVLPVDLSFCKGKQKHFNELPKEKFLLIIPGCSPLHPYKKWPSQNYLDLVLKAEKEGIPSVILGTDAESQEIDFICNNSKALSFKNKASLLDIPALSQKALCIIGNDTGPVHLASLGKTKAFVLFCNRTAKSAQKRENIKNFSAENISDISPETIYNEVHKIMEGQKSERKTN